MATFTALDRADALAIARAFDLPQPEAVIPIAAGTINSNFAFVADGQRWFVRINEGKTASDVAWEAGLVTALAAAGVPTPPPRTIDGQPWLVHRGLLVSAFPWIDGAIVAAADVAVHHAHALGTALGRLHVAADGHPGRDGIYQWPDVVARLPRIVGAARPELAVPVATLTAAVDELAALAPVRAVATRGIIHADLFRDNVLWQRGAITALLDFEQASSGSLVYDVAVAVNDWCWAGALRPDLARALVAAHRAARPWSDADRAALPAELLAAAVRFTITRLTDVYLRQVDNPDKDFRAFLARVDYWRSDAGQREMRHLADS